MKSEHKCPDCGSNLEKMYQGEPPREVRFCTASIMSNTHPGGFIHIECPDGAPIHNGEEVPEQSVLVVCAYFYGLQVGMKSQREISEAERQAGPPKKGKGWKKVTHSFDHNTGESSAKVD